VPCVFWPMAITATNGARTVVTLIVRHEETHRGRSTEFRVESLKVCRLSRLKSPRDCHGSPFFFFSSCKWDVV
jgi:hypothetical protein